MPVCPLCGLIQHLDYTLDGRQISMISETEAAEIRNRHIGFIFQSFNLLSRTTSLKNVMLPLVYDKENRLLVEQREAMAMDALASVTLTSV